MGYIDSLLDHTRGAYDATLGPTGHALRQVPANVIGGAGQAYNDFTGGIKGAYGGTGHFLNRGGDAVNNLVEQTPIIIRDITVPAGRSLENLSNVPKDLGTPISLGLVALLALGGYLLVREQRTGTVTRAAAAGATRG